MLNTFKGGFPSVKKVALSCSLLIVLLITAFLGVKSFKANELLDISTKDWSMIKSDDNMQNFASPFFYIGKGSYIVNVKYDTDEDLSFSVSSSADNSYNLETYLTTLHWQNHTANIEFESKGPTDNVQIFISSENNFDIQDVSIYRTHNQERRLFSIFLLALILACLCFVYREKILANNHKLSLLIMIGVIASIPLFSYGVEIGHDLYFHLLRIEGIATELSAGHFPVRMQSYINYGHGYPVSIYYGDILLYFPALLRLLGFTIIQAYKSYAFAINLLTSLVSYYAGRKIFKNDLYAMLFCASYALSSYRFMDMYVRIAGGEYTAMLFFPLVMLGIYEIYFSDVQNSDIINKQGLFYLSLGMTGVITCHILSTEMVCIFLIVFSLIFIRKTIQRPVILTLIASVFTTTLLSAWFIIPFVDYYINVDTNINTVADTVASIQWKGAYITQYFAVFKSIFGTNDTLIVNRMSVTPGLLLMCVLCTAIYLSVCTYNKTIKRLTTSIIFILFLSSNMFPWDYISRYKIGNILAQIQFPWRWVAFACILLSLLLVVVVDHLINSFNINKHILYAVSIVLLVIQIGADCSSYSTNAPNIRYPKYSTDLDATDYREYYRAGSDFFSLCFEPSGSNVETGYLVNQKGTDFTFYIETNSNGDVTLPILNYKGYIVTDEDGNSYTIKDGEQKEITISLSANYDGKIFVSYKEPFYWRIAEIISLITVIAMICYLYVNVNKNAVLKERSK